MNSNWSYSPETPNLGQIRRFLEPCDLEIWRMTLKNNRAPLLSNIKLYASFYHHMWIQTGVTVRKRLSWVVTSVTLTFDLWLWPFAWTLLWSLVITPENFMMIRWWEHSQKGVTDRQTDILEKTQMYCDRIDEDSSAYSESFKRVESTNWEYRRVRATHQLPVPQTHWFAVSVW